MDFKKILNMQLEKNELVLGHNDLDGFLTVNIEENPSIIITGQTGSGKSILLDQILLQLINRYTTLEMELILIDTTGVELNYYADSKYSDYPPINDDDKCIVAISRVLKEIERRKKILEDAKYLTAYDYNLVSEEKLPLLVIAIDESAHLLRNEDMEKMLSGIITQLKGLNILFILVTSDVHNRFFELDNNVLASLSITFDFTNKEETRKVNIEDADALKTGEFKAKIDDKEILYHNFQFDDNLIKEMLNR